MDAGGCPSKVRSGKGKRGQTNGILIEAGQARWVWGGSSSTESRDPRGHRRWMDRPAAQQKPESNATAARQVPLGKDAVDSHGRGRAGPQHAPVLDSIGYASVPRIAWHWPPSPRLACSTPLPTSPPSKPARATHPYLFGIYIYPLKWHENHPSRDKISCDLMRPPLKESKSTSSSKY